MILCLCQGVSDRTVRLAVMNGASSVDAVAARCGAGTDCGSCRHAIAELIEDGHMNATVGTCGHADSGTTVTQSVAAAP